MHYSFRFLLATLAVWRITHLLAREDGPRNIVTRLRDKLGEGILGRLVTCFYCLSIWVALPFAWFLKGDAAETFVGWLALSGAAILVERMAREPLELKIEEAEQWNAAAKQ
jgi:hypothetical protein